jgi:hypothetical protein
VVLYFERYWILLAGLAGAALAALRRATRSAPPPEHKGPGALLELALAAAIALTYTAYVMRVGGDFMYARMLIPATPFYLLLLDLGALTALGRRPAAYAVVGVVLVAGLVLPNTPIPGRESVHGIRNERAFYADAVLVTLDRRAEVFSRYFKGLPVRLAFLGSEARVMYKARIPYAVECETGLTDRFIARQSLPTRRRVGHEKHAPVPYLIDELGINFTFHPKAEQTLPFDEYIPRGIIALDDVRGRILHWDAELLGVLRARGARFHDFTAFLDGYIANMDARAHEDIAVDYAAFSRFYFDHVDDMERRQRFERRLAGADD